MSDSGDLDSTYSTFALGDFPLTSGAVLHSASIAYKLLGPPDSPVIVVPTWFSGLISDNFYLLEILSTTTHRILIPALFGNGQSTSPTNTTQRPFPAVTVADNVTAQQKLLQHLGIEEIFSVVGWSMGGMTALQWAAQYPDLFTDGSPGVVAICATAKCSIHNAVFLEGVKATLLVGAAGAASKGAGTREEVVVDVARREATLKAMGRVYAGWGFSQAFYRGEGYKELGYKDLEDWMTRFWETWALSKDIENLLCMIQTWQTADISSTTDEDLPIILQRIKIPALFLFGDLDLYFHRDDIITEAALIPQGVCEVIPGWDGHWAGGPGGHPENTKRTRERITKWLGEKVRVLSVGRELAGV